MTKQTQTTKQATGRFVIPQIAESAVMAELRRASKGKERNYVTAPELADKYAKAKNKATGKPRRSLGRHVLQRMADEGKVDLYQVGNKLAATLPGDKIRGA